MLRYHHNRRAHCARINASIREAEVKAREERTINIGRIIRLKKSRESEAETEKNTVEEDLLQARLDRNRRNSPNRSETHKCLHNSPVLLLHISNSRNQRNLNNPNLRQPFRNPNHPFLLNNNNNNYSNSSSSSNSSSLNNNKHSSTSNSSNTNSSNHRLLHSSLSSNSNSSCSLA